MKYQRQIFSIKSKYINVSPNKLKIILKKLQKNSYKDTQFLLTYLPNKVSKIIWKYFFSICSIASNLLNIKKEYLFFLESFSTPGSILKRSQPRAKGRSFLIQKKRSYLTLSVCSIKFYLILHFIQNLII